MPRRSAVSESHRRPLYRGPKSTAFRDFFVRAGSGSAEAQWQLVETTIPALTKELEDGHWPLTGPTVRRLKDLVAVHYARSLLTWERHHDLWEADLARQADELRANPQLTLQTYSAETGIVTTGSGGLERAVEWYVAPSVRDFKTGVFFRLRVEELYKSAQGWFEDMALSVVLNPWSEYLLSDVPVLSLGTNSSSGLPLREPGLAHAMRYILPITPKIAVYLDRGGDGRRRVSSLVEARLVNLLNIGAARESIYLHPDPKGLDLAESALAARYPLENDEKEPQK